MLRPSPNHGTLRLHNDDEITTSTSISEINRHDRRLTRFLLYATDMKQSHPDTYRTRTTPTNWRLCHELKTTTRLSIRRYKERPSPIGHRFIWSYDRSSGATIDLRSVVEYHDWSPSATIDRTIDRRVPRLIYDRSQNPTIYRTIDRWWLPLVVRFPTMDLAIDLLQSLLIARPRVRSIVRCHTTSQKTDCRMRQVLEIVANVRHIATNRTINKSYDPVWLWL